MIDFTNCEVRKKAYGGANGTKKCIVYNSENYMLKIPSHPTRETTLSYTNSCISEYIGCHIYELLGIPVQKTILGTYMVKNKKRLVVVCKDFTKPGIVSQDFAALKNQVVDSASGGYDTDIDEILSAIEKQESIDPVQVTERFWDMFVVDALLGNFDRHNGNWGFLYNDADDKLELAPVYDCGSCLYPQADKETMEKILSDIGELHTRVYNYPTSAIKQNGKKLSYYKFLLSTNDENCLQALIKLYPRINFNKINTLIDTIDALDELQKQFYKTMLSERYQLILVPAYKRAVDLLQNKSRNSESPDIELEDERD